MPVRLDEETSVRSAGGSPGAGPQGGVYSNPKELGEQPPASLSDSYPCGNQLAEVKVRPAAVFIAFILIWSFVTFAATVTVWEFYHVSGRTTSFGTVAGMEASEFLSFIPVAPLAFLLTLRFPLQRHNWIKPMLLYLVGGLAYNIGHITFRGLTPYGYWDPTRKEWTFAFWDTYSHTFRNVLTAGKTMFLTTVVDDFIASYVPILIVAHAFVYYRSFHERELQAMRLEEQLASSRLQALKSQLQPHFLFNTLHSISALMWTDVVAADRMMTSLSDLLRLSLENDEIHVTTLSREIEFLGIYLDIEKVRFEERLQVVFEIDPECLDAQVPHLLLQPLVENAVRHGISKLPRGGEIRIIARRGHGRTLDIWIRDNGPGVSSPSQSESRQGLGLKLTRERLSALYREKQVCELRNLSTGGAEVYLRLPLRTIGTAASTIVMANHSAPQSPGKAR